MSEKQVQWKKKTEETMWREQIKQNNIEKSI